MFRVIDRILAFDSRDGGDAQLGGSKKSALHDFQWCYIIQMCSIVEPDAIITVNGNSSGYPCRWILMQ